MKNSGGNSILRMVWVGLAVILQAAWLVVLNVRLNEYFEVVSTLTSLLAVVVVLKLYSRHTTADMKMPWVMLILVFPVMGLTLYLMLLVFGDPGGTRKRLAKVRENLPQELRNVPAGMEWSRGSCSVVSNSL